jgi:hypothetical protein
MPQSDPFAIGIVTWILEELSPTSILEIGVGMGKYGLIIREQLEVARGRLHPTDWIIRIDGIEAFPDYHNPIHDWVYNKIWWGDALELLPKLADSYDVFLAVDVIEHLIKEEGQKVLRWALDHTKYSVISTPRYYWTQEAMFGNLYEQHRSLWRPRDFPGQYRQCWVLGPQLIVLLSNYPFSHGLSRHRFALRLGIHLLKSFTPSFLLGLRSKRSIRI